MPFGGDYIIKAVWSPQESAKVEHQRQLHGLEAAAEAPGGAALGNPARVAGTPARSSLFALMKAALVMSSEGRRDPAE